jgi:hypothetical protein
LRTFLLRGRGSASLCRPRFSFFNIQLSKNRHHKRDVARPFAFGSGPERVSLTRLSETCQLKGFLEANFSAASGAPPSLLSRVICRAAQAVNNDFKVFEQIPVAVTDTRPVRAISGQRHDLRHMAVGAEWWKSKLGPRPGKSAFTSPGDNEWKQSAS